MIKDDIQGIKFNLNPVDAVMKLLGIFIFGFLLPGIAYPQQKKIYLAPDDHTDYMWSGNEEAYRNAFLETLDFYIRLNDSTANESYPYQSKWNCDGSYWIYEYQRNRSAAQFSKLIEQVREGKITVPLNTLPELPGAAPLESILRDMYYAGSLERKFGLDLDLVINMEDQVIPLGLSSLWAGSGAKYSWRGVCDCATKVTGLYSRPHEIYWFRGPDDQRILMKWYSMVGNNRQLGGYAEARDPQKSVLLCKELMESSKYPYLISGAFGKGWDDLKTTTSEFIDVARANSDPEYQVIVSNETDFFRDFEKTYGDVLPSESVSYGSTEWGNSLASLANVSAGVKRSIEKLRSAEALFTIGELIKNSGNRQEAFFVFNPLSWIRTDYCDYPYSGSPMIKVFDLNTGSETPFQFIVKKDAKYLRILAKDVPSLGYRSYEIRNSSPKKEIRQAASITGNIIENDNYKIDFSPQGSIYSLIDKDDGNREYIKPDGDVFANDLCSSGSLSGLPLRIENQGEVSVTLTAESDEPIKHISKITLFGFNDRIELENFIVQKPGPEPVTYAFSFNLYEPAIWNEEAGAILKARQQSDGGDYADSICRLDWIAMNHFADISDESRGIIISNRDAIFMKTGNSTVNKLDPKTSCVKVLAAGQIDGPGLGFIDQDGDSCFEDFFALRTHKNAFSVVNAMKFSMEHQDPLLAGKIIGRSEDYEQKFSLFKVSNPNILVWALKPAEEGIEKGIILRVWNMGNNEEEVVISSPAGIKRCIRTSHIETDISEVIPEREGLKLKIGHNRLQTFRIFLK